MVHEMNIYYAKTIDFTQLGLFLDTFAVSLTVLSGVLFSYLGRIVLFKQVNCVLVP